MYQQRFRIIIASDTDDDLLLPGRERISAIVELCNWATGRTERLKYVVEPITAVYVVLRKPFYQTRWKDVKDMFGMRASEICKVFYKVTEPLLLKHGHKVGMLCDSLITKIAETYAKAMS